MGVGPTAPCGALGFKPSCLAYSSPSTVVSGTLDHVGDEATEVDAPEAEVAGEIEAQLNGAFFAKAEPPEDNFFQRWAEPILGLIIILLIPIVVALGVIALDTRKSVNDLARTSKGNREARIVYQAEQNYLACSTAPNNASAAFGDGIKIFCADYTNMDAAIAAERAKQELADASIPPD